MFWSIKNSSEVLRKLKDRDFEATSLSTYDFSTLYTTLPNNLIKEKLLDLIERTFHKKECKLCLACNDKKAFSTLQTIIEDITFGLVRMYVMHYRFLVDNIHIRFVTKLYKQVIGIPMGTNFAPLVADLFLFCHERDFMKDLSNDNQADVIKAFNSMFRYLDNLLVSVKSSSLLIHSIPP